MARMQTSSPSSRSATRASSNANPPLKPPPFQPVQLATLVDTVPTGDRWLHEMKYDGYRLLVAVGGGAARAYTRSGLDWSEKFANVVGEAAKLDVRSALLDGEAVVMDENGRSDFQALQGALKGAPASIDYVVFDLLELDGEDLTALPLTERKAKLREILPEGGHRIRYSEHIEGNGEKLLHNFCDAGLEGVISKKADGRYIGSRSGGWLKTKCIKRQEFVVVGWTPSDKSRLFRSLILGIYEDGVLRYAGKVGTGFGNDEIIRPDGDDGSARAVDRDREGAAGRGPRRPLAQAPARCGDRVHRDDQRGHAAASELSRFAWRQEGGGSGPRGRAAGGRDRGSRRLQGDGEQPGSRDLSRIQHHQGPARRLLRRRRADHATLGR